MRSIRGALCGERRPIRIWGIVMCVLGGPAASTAEYLNPAGLGGMAVAAGVSLLLAARRRTE